MSFYDVMNKLAHPFARALIKRFMSNGVKEGFCVRLHVNGFYLHESEGFHAFLHATEIFSNKKSENSFSRNPRKMF